MDFYYVNSADQRVNFYDYPYLFQEGDLLDYSHSYSVAENTNKIEYTSKSQEKTVKLAVLPDFSLSLEQRRQAVKQHVDELLELLEYDVVNNKLGKLYSSTGYYLECNIFASKKSDWNLGIPFLFNQFSVIAPKQKWIKEITYNFYPQDGESQESTEVKQYPFLYPYLYGDDSRAQLFDNDHFSASDFKLIAYGPFSDFYVQINDHLYQVDYELESNEYMTIDSRNKTIIMTNQYGEQTNLFQYQDFSSDVFKKIEPGNNTISYSRTFGIDLIIYQERSEPAWA